MFPTVRFCSFCLALLIVATASAQEPDSKSGTEIFSSPEGIPRNESFYVVDSLNEGVPEIPDPPDLSTPLATVENFLSSSRDEEFKRAAQSLNFKLIPEKKRDQAEDLARKFYYALNQRLWIDIEDLPDRQDGQMINRLNTQDPMAGKPRRSILLGIIRIDEWKEVRVRLQRVKHADAEPVWLFSPQTVEKIPALYQEFGPSWIEEQMPEWGKNRIVGKVPLWEWLALMIFVVTGTVVGYLTQKVVGKFTLHRSHQKRFWVERFIESINLPVACATAVFCFYLLKQTFLSLTGPVNTFLDPLLLIMIAGSVAWLILRGLDVAANFAMERYVNMLEDEEEGAQQGLLTKISIARRLLTMIAVFVVIGIVLIQLNFFYAVGYGLLASAGVSTVILGIAAQPILGNFLAGLQIGLTQPVRIGDSVLFEGNWGYAEEITFTYLTIRTWDKRRLIVPLQYLLSQPMENWTKSSSDLTKPIKLYLDYTTDVQKVREKYAKMVTQHELWDEESEPTVQVTNCTEETIEIRALCHAKNPGDAWDLHCEMREKLIAYVQELESGQFLPRERVRVVEEESENRDSS